MGVIRYIDSFDHQIDAATGNHYVSPVNILTAFYTAAPIHGAASFQMDAANGGQRLFQLASPSNKNVARFYFKLINQQRAAVSPATCRICRLRNAGDTAQIDLQMSTQDVNVQTMQLKDNLGGVTPPVNFQTNVLYRIDIKYDWSANPWLADWQIAVEDGVGVQQAQLVSANAADTAVYWANGAGSAQSLTNFLLDSVVVANGDLLDYPFPPGPVVAYVPSGVGTHVLDASPSSFFFTDDNTTEVAITSAESTSYQMLDDVVLDSGVDRVEIHPSPANTTYLEHVFAPGLVANPRACKIIHAVRQDTATASPVTGRIYDGATAIDIYTALNINSVALLYQQRMMDVAPSGAAWTAALANALRSRFGFTANATGVPRLEAVMLEIFQPITAYPSKQWKTIPTKARQRASRW